MSVLRIYDPHECDERGIPLDWERCRTCGGRGWDYDRDLMNADVVDHGQRRHVTCPICDGHGSLKAAALASRLMRFRGSVRIPDPEHRCEDCEHPMSEGTWEAGARVREMNRADEGLAPHRVPNTLKLACAVLRDGRAPEDGWTHFSPCDEGCGHGGPGRLNGKPVEKITGETDAGPGAGVGLAITMHRALTDPQAIFEASWRPVDVRTLGWPHDLRPEKLAVLCLRCFARRPAARELAA